MLHRRTVLKAAGGVALGLPWLEAMADHLKPDEKAPPLRIGFVAQNNGAYMTFWQPGTAGRDYKMPYSLQAFEPLRDRMNVYTGINTNDGEAGHGPEPLLTGRRGNTIPGYTWRQSASIDQVIAESAYGQQARFPSLNLSTGGVGIYTRIAFTSDSVPVPCIGDPRDLYEKLFVDEDAKSVDVRIRRLKKEKRLLDAVLEQSKGLAQELGAADRRKLDQYLTAVRQVEKDLAREEAWIHTPKPSVPMPKTNAPAGYSQRILFYDLLALALQTDSTRTFTFWAGVEQVPGHNNQHGGSHCGNEEFATFDGMPANHRDFVEYNKDDVTLFADFATKLSEMNEGDGTVLDHCALFFASQMRMLGHSGYSIPLLSVGSLSGKLKTGSHVELSPFPYNAEMNSKLRADYKGRPIGDLHLTLLHQLGIEVKEHGVGKNEIGEILV